MLRYLNTQVVFQEFPGEVTLAINITGCPHHCPGCHSPELWKDKGEELTADTLQHLVDICHGGITCIGFMGGDGDLRGLRSLASYCREAWPHLKLGWYSGNDVWSDDMMDPFDYVKFGPYVEARGGLDHPATNQVMFKRIRCVNRWLDITGYFQVHDKDWRAAVDNFETHLQESIQGSLCPPDTLFQMDRQMIMERLDDLQGKHTG